MSCLEVSFEGAGVRHEVDSRGNPWFVARDVGGCLGLLQSAVSRAVGKMEVKDKGMISVDTPGGRQRVAAVSESGLYALIMQSRKPEAIRFQKWVTGEVLPAIRKTGRYEVQSPAEDALILQAVGILQGRVEEAEKRAIAAESTVEQQAPFVAFAEQVRASTGDMTISTACKHLDLIATGANGIFTWLRRNKWIAAKYRDGVNQPNLTATSRGYMRLVERCYPDSETGEIVSKSQLLLTASGVVWLSEVAPQRCRRPAAGQQLTLLVAQ